MISHGERTRRAYEFNDVLHRAINAAVQRASRACGAEIEWSFEYRFFAVGSLDALVLRVGHRPCVAMPVRFDEAAQRFGRPHEFIRVGELLDADEPGAVRYATDPRLRAGFVRLRDFGTNDLRDTYEATDHAAACAVAVAAMIEAPQVRAVLMREGERLKREADASQKAAVARANPGILRHIRECEAAEKAAAAQDAADRDHWETSARYFADVSRAGAQDYQRHLYAQMVKAGAS